MSGRVILVKRHNKPLVLLQAPDVLGEGGVEMVIGPDEFDEEVDEVEAVESAGLVWFC